MKNTFLFIAFLFFMTAQAQNYKYDIVLFNDVIGTGTANQSKNNDGSINYVLKTQAKAKVMFKERTSTSDISLNFKNNVLTSGKLKREKDGEWQDVELKYENGKHYFVEGGTKKQVIKPIQFTTTQFFFTEPIGLKEVYVERLNEFVPIVKDGSTYVTEIEGGTNFYTYKNGVLVEFRMKNVINVYMNKV